MIFPGRAIVAQRIVQNIRVAKIQAQPCGVDLTLKRLLNWKSFVDFDNSYGKIAQTNPFGFKSDPASKNPPGTAWIDLPLGSYLVEFNEMVDVPLDVMGQIFVRSSLFRSGAVLTAGVMDSGYKGAVGALLQVVNPQGLRLYKDARLAQVVFHQMSEPTEGYLGVYQGSESL